MNCIVSTPNANEKIHTYVVVYEKICLLLQLMEQKKSWKKKVTHLGNDSWFFDDNHILKDEYTP